MKTYADTLDDIYECALNWVAEDADKGVDEMPPDWEATKALADAAPKLLAALKDLLGEGNGIGAMGDCHHCGRQYETDDLPDHCIDDCPGEVARAAIAEAEAVNTAPAPA